MPLIAVGAASGQLGHLVVEALKRRVPVESIIALARTPTKVSGLGVSVKPGDYSDVEEMHKALTGVDSFLLISSNDILQRVPQHANAIEAAKRAGVKHLVYTSLLHADSSPLLLAEDHRKTEALIKSSGIHYTILRNGWYTENQTAGLGAAIAHGAVIGSAGNGKFSAAARADFAEAAAVVLSSSGHDNCTYELAGDDSYTLAELAAEVSSRTGKTIVYKDLPEADYAAALASFGLPQSLAAALANCDVLAGKGALFNDKKQLSTLIRRPTTSMSTVVAQAVGTSQAAATH